MNMDARPYIIGTAVLGTQHITQGIGCEEKSLLQDMKDGRFANWLIGLWLEKCGFTRVDDDQSGYLYQNPEDSNYYRLRVGGDRVALSPSVARGAGRAFTRDGQVREMVRIDGFILAFGRHAPSYKLWLVPNEVAIRWKGMGIFGKEWIGDSDRVIVQLNQEAIE